MKNWYLRSLVMQSQNHEFDSSTFSLPTPGFIFSTPGKNTPPNGNRGSVN